MMITHLAPSKVYWLPALLLCLLLARPLRAEVSPSRLLLLRGAIALGERQPDRAVADLQEAAGMHPEDWHTQLLYGQALVLAGDHALAKGLLRRATLLAPLNPQPWQALAEAARAMNDPHLELAALSGLLRITPDNPRQLRRLAALYRTMGRVTDADTVDAQWQATLPPIKLNYRYIVGFHSADLRELRELARTEPANRALLHALATEEWRAGNDAAARDVLQQLLAEAPDNRELLLAYASLCLRTDRLDEGLRLLRDNTQGVYSLDRALALWSLSAGRYGDAAGALQRLLERTPIDAAQNRQLGLMRLLSGNAAGACDAYRLAWLRDHDQITAQHYAVALQAAGRAEEAEEILTRAIKLAPTVSALELQLALLYRDTDRLQQSAQLTAALAKKRPESVELLILAGERFFRAGHYPRTNALARALRDDYPADARAMLGAVTLFRRLAARDEARLTLTRYLGPNFPPPVPAAEILLTVARFAMADNNLDGAVLALEEALKRAPDTRQAYRLLGLLHQQRADWTQAQQAYQRALARLPDDPEFTLAQARVSWQAGNYPQAIALYRKAAARMPAADPLLELGTLYSRQGEEARARACWLEAQARPGGAIRARLSLLNGAERANGQAEALRAELTALLARERARRAERWRALLDDAGIAPTAEEIDALLLLEPDLTDPAPLLAPRPAPEPDPAPEPAPEPEPRPEPVPAPEPRPEPAPTPEPDPGPTPIHLPEGF